MKFEKVTTENLPLAIKIQHDIFPFEDGSPFLIFSVEKSKVSHLNMLDYWLAYENENVVGIRTMRGLAGLVFWILAEERALGKISLIGQKMKQKREALKICDFTQTELKMLLQ